MRTPRTNPIASVRKGCLRSPFRSGLWVALSLVALLLDTGCGKPAVVQAPVTPPDEPAKNSGGGEVTVELNEAQKAELRTQAQRDLAETERILSALDRGNLSADQQEKLHSVEGLLAAARAAGEKDDVTAMANLARKARLLAGELVPG